MYPKADINSLYNCVLSYSHNSCEYTAMGNAANLAARLESAAQPGQVMVGERTYRLTQRAFEFESVPNLSPKGIEKPVS
jgi:class 3 adenylate cyclase